MFTCLPGRTKQRMPRKCKFRLSKLFGKFRRRRGSQGSNPLKGARPYLIPTTPATTNKSKAPSGDSHGYINPVEWEFPSKSRSVEECSTMSSTDSLSGSGLAKTPPGSVGERPCHSSGEKTKKAPTRNLTQPEGTFAYTVDKNDTLTSIAARFETTPSELAKINRLVSRLICPGKVIFVPEKSAEEAKTAAARRSSPTKDQAQQQGSLKAESPPSDILQSSPKPGRAERICDSPSPPHRSAIKFLSKEEEQKLDQECMERFLKINGVKHITDGQGVVSGVLLVTPNAAMFEPSVMETLVSERGIDQYHVTAPLQNVANAALYTDIAHMKVRHAPVQAASLPPPEIYFPKSAHPPKIQDGGESEPPRRSESQQAVKGSVSDKADLDLSEEDDDSLGSCPSESKGSEKSAGSEVFADGPEERTKTAEPSLVEEPEEPDQPQQPEQPQQPQQPEQPEHQHPAKMREDRKGTEGSGASVRFSDPESDSQGRSSPKRGDAGLPNGRVAFPGPPPQPKEARRVLPQFPFLQDGVVARKHSVQEAPKALKTLKRLSYAGAEASEEALDLGPSPSALSRILNAPRTLADLSGSQEQPTALSRILNSPRQLVDFSTGLFQRNTNDVSRVEDVSQFQRQMSYSLPTPLPTGEDAIDAFFGERRGSSPDAALADARNAHAAVGRRFSDGASPEHPAVRAVANAAGRPGSREDIRIEFKSEVTLEDKKDLFQNIDEIVPVPARSCDDPPLYLCLRMGRPVKTKASGLTSPSSANGRQQDRRPKKPLKSEYWFSIPKDRVDELYHFLEQWAPGAYGSIEDVDPKDRGLELISADELSDEELDGGSGRTSDMADVARRRIGLLGETHPDWEVVSLHDVRENRFSNMSLDLELPLPELIGDSEILTEEHRREIFRVLPARAEGYSWSLIFSAAEHGFSLQSMYRRMARYESPVLLIIQDTENNVFGAMTSCILKTSDHFYGTGESFLFTFYSQFKTFKWTGENVFFIKGNPDCLAIGAGDGLFGLWLDGDLYHGRSHRCKTYNNDTLSSNEDFCVKLLEAWGFVDFGVSDSSLC